jgi:hypothetical protein
MNRRFVVVSVYVGQLARTTDTTHIFLTTP